MTQPDYQQKNISANDFENCTKCTICTVYCPVTAVNSLFPGPKHAGPDGERYRLKRPDFYNQALKYCLNCKRCEVACPSLVRIGDIIQAARIKYTDRPVPLRDFMLANTDLMGTVANRLAPIVNTTLSLYPVKKLMDVTLGIDDHRQFPKYTSERFTTWFKRHAQERQHQFKRYVAYFHGCYVQYNYPELGKALVKILNALGFGVQLLDKEKCCGVAKIANRLVKEATRDAKINLEAIRRAVLGRKLPVLGTSSTCTFTIRDEYPHLLHLDNHDVRDSIMLATRFIFEQLERGNAKIVWRDDYKIRTAYHTPCHMSKLGWEIFSTSLMQMIPGLEFVPLDQKCCGIAGTYGFKKENYKYSQEIGEQLFAQIRATNPQVVSTDCETCKWQIEMSTGYKVVNPIEIVADAMDEEATCRANGVPFQTKS